MKERREAGEQIDSNNIKKHKNDVFRLLANVTPSSRVETAEKIQNDIIKFIEQIKNDKPDFKNLGIRNTSFNEVMEVLESTFLQKSEA